MRSAVLAAVCLGLAGCPALAPPPDAGHPVKDASAQVEAASDGGDDSGPATLPAAKLPFTVTVVGGDGGHALDAVPVDASFEVQVLARVPQLRVRLADATGRGVNARDEWVVGPTTVYRLRPESKLAPGSAYTLEIGPDATAQTLTDAEGNRYPDERLRLTTMGEKPRPASKRQNKKR